MTDILMEDHRKLMAEIAALKKDAERYRYLRNMSSVECCIQCGYDGIELRTGKLLDAAIDAAMEVKK